ncbi:MAG: hypothetical protein KBH45_00905 [Verrucomicrobia bacterium]|nr:hypothetical protein [Verrucomicrobiota bacterium]
MKSSSSPNTRNPLSTGCLALFGLPFAGFGLFALGMCVREAQAGKLNQAAMLAIFGLVFSSVGFGLGAGAFYAQRKLKAIADKRAQHPTQPWLWRDDWAAGEVRSTGRGKIFALWLITLFWNAVSSFVWFIVPAELAKGRRAAWVAFLFPAVGLLMLFGAIRATLTWRKFGQARFRSKSLPGTPGGVLEGHIELNSRLAAADGLRLQLRCVCRESSGSGKNRRTTDHTLWEDEKLLGPNLPEHRPYCTTIPVFIRLPPDQPESDHDDDPQRNLAWRLRASAKVAGPDLDVEFEVPVFKTGVAALPANAPDPTAKYQLPLDQMRLAGHSRIQVADTYTGAREFIFPAARNLSAAVGGAGFALVWTGVIWFLLHVRAPLIFPIVFGLFDLLLLWFCAELWLRSSRIVISRQEVTVTHRWVLFRRATTIPTADVAGITTKIGMTSGQFSYYDIKLTRRNGRPVTVGTAVPGKVEAEWLVHEMEMALGKNNSAATRERLP